MAGVAPVSPSFQFFDSSGNPLVSGKLYVYLAGTTTQTNTWQDSSQSTLNTNPIILNAAGRCTIWFDSTLTYKLELQNSAGVVQPGYPVDNVPGSAATSANVNFLQAGAGAITRTVQSRLRDSVSVKDFGIVGDGVTDDTAAIQAALNYVNTNNLDLFFPPSTYLVSSGLTLVRSFNDTKGIRVFGAGRGRSILKYTGAGAMTSMLDISAAGGGFSINNEIDGIKFDLSGAPAGTIGLKVRAGIWRSNFRKLYVTRSDGGRTGTGIYMGSATPGDVGTFDNKFSELYINNFSKNLHFQGTDLSENTITNCSIDHSYISGGVKNLQAEYYNGLSSNNTQFESATQHGVYCVSGETMVITGGSIESPEAGAVGIGMDANTKSVIALCDFYNNAGGNFVTNGQIGHYYKASNSGHTYPPGSEIRLDHDGAYKAHLRYFRNGVADVRVRVADSGNSIAWTNSADTELMKFDASNSILEILTAAGFMRLRDGAYLQFFGSGVERGTIRSGSGTPEGAVSAQIGSLYLRTDGGAGTTLYVKESGGGNTGWVAK